MSGISALNVAIKLANGKDAENLYIYILVFCERLIGYYSYGNNELIKKQFTV